METVYIVLIVLAALLVLVLGTSLVCFFMTFYAKTPKPLDEGELDMIPGHAYDKYRPQMREWITGSREIKSTHHEIISHDGKRLAARYFEYDKTGPIEIMFHGYKGSAERDMSGGIFRARELGHSAFLVNHRASRGSEGHVITFGIKEREDLRRWVEYVCQTCGGDRQIILTGISMGVATVMLASSMELPDNVKCILADCGYTSAPDIIKRVIKENMHLSSSFFYPFVRLGAIIFGGFDPNETSPERELKRARLPVIFIHGDADTFVPAYMSERNFAACASEKKLVIIKGAEHGVAYPADMETYVSELREFFSRFIEYR